MIELKLSGKVTSENAGRFENEFFKIIGNTVKPEISVDASELEYISSAGLRVLLQLKKIASSVTVSGVTPEVMEIFEMTGLNSMLNVRRKVNEINVDGLEIIGEGVTSVVYRIDDEKILKLYREGYTEDEIRTEQAVTRKAFALGVPTMISYDIVKSGDRYGAVYEALNFSTLKSQYINSSEKEKIMIAAKHADFLREISGISADKDEFESFKEGIINNLELKKEKLTEEAYTVYKELIDMIPDDSFFIHGDCHMDNILVDDNGEYYLIDFGICGYGNPVFALHTICLYRVFADIITPEAYQKKTDFSIEEGRKFWENFTKAYFNNADEADLSVIRDCIYIYCCIFSTLRYDFLTQKSVDTLSDYVVKHNDKDNFNILFSRGL